MAAYFGKEQNLVKSVEFFASHIGGLRYETELVLLIWSGTIVVAFGLGLIGFAVLVTVKRLDAERLVDLFASSARAHYTEQVARLVVGTAMVSFSPSMWYSYLFEGFGWLIVVTSVGLLLVPWWWHQRLAERVLPLVIRFLELYAVGAFALGAFILYGASRSASS